MIRTILLHADHSRAGLIEEINNHRAKGPYSVIDVGGSLSTPGLEVDAIVDMVPSQETIRGVSFFQGNICMPEVWGKVLLRVKKNGQYDFCICSHTLEDVSNPEYVCYMMSRIAKAGFIAVPSKYVELCRNDEGFRGYVHHRWVYTLTKEGALIGYPKFPFLEHEEALRSKVYRPQIAELAVYWEGSIDLVIAGGGIYGPAVAPIRKLYHDGLTNDYFKEFASL